ncbi:NADP-dependent phosphogluconate dehydrogenase [uncultured Tateyamaria sp.]|uniref:NADP-dependent phosphogluconate dehydrogenase n=1 Tax=uncultured Tateyamaria sp. TaxID=455651 RepID=UPI00262CBF4A|nr:NADP-dependent phosphogluconate dehydrogenase [uncultured Tateyamaria sp.]
MRADIGVYGLGTMGSALALNMIDNGFVVAVSNRSDDKIAPFLKEADGLSGSAEGHSDLGAFVEALKTPRTVLLMVPSGKATDAMIDALRPLLSDGDTIIDGGNADFNDTRSRHAAVDGSGVHFVGMGVSGGEEGARRGPSMMVGGSAHSWAQFRPMAEAIAADFEGTPCVAHVGPDGAGHFVKTVHNGIEYADMQMIAEIYGIQRDMAGLPVAEIGAMFARWKQGPLSSYLIESAADVLAATESQTGRPMIEVIVDSAGQKGTGRWTVIEALKLGQSASAIEAAVGARGWSSEKEARVAGQDTLTLGAQSFEMPSEADLEAAMLAGRILAHAQGFRVMAVASEAFEWSLDMAQIAEIWRAGCIIRSALLDVFADAFRGTLRHDHMILAPAMASRLAETLPGLRRVVVAANLAGQPVPALSAALAWHDSMAAARGTADMIQGLRDYFGAHGFERIDADGAHHGDWG